MNFAPWHNISIGNWALDGTRALCIRIWAPSDRVWGITQGNLGVFGGFSGWEFEWFWAYFYACLDFYHRDRFILGGWTRKALLNTPMDRVVSSEGLANNYSCWLSSIMNLNYETSDRFNHKQVTIFLNLDFYFSNVKHDFNGYWSKTHSSIGTYFVLLFYDFFNWINWWKLTAMWCEPILISRMLRTDTFNPVLRIKNAGKQVFS